MKVNKKMNNRYINRYNSFIEYCRGRSIEIGTYTEIHHIIPVCLGGNNASDNLIVMTAREHYLAHWILWKAYDNPSLTNAFFMMCRQNKKQNREIIPSYLYEKLKKEMAIIAAERGKSRIWITNGIEDKFIDKNSEIPSGWGRGRTLTKDITKIDIYKKEKNSLIFVFTADSTYDALQFINKNSNKLILGRSLKGRCENAKNGQGSKAGDFYICYHEGYPIIKTANSLPGSATTAKGNRGKKRPEHSKIMKEYFLKKDKKNIYYFIHITGLKF